MPPHFDCGLCTSSDFVFAPLCCRAYMLLLREGLTIKGECSNRDWVEAAHVMMMLVQSCVRNNLLHHACGCYNESSLTKHMLLLPSTHTTPAMAFPSAKPPKDITLFKLMQRCVVSRQCTCVNLVDSAPVSHHASMDNRPFVQPCPEGFLLHCQRAQALEMVLYLAVQQAGRANECWHKLCSYPLGVGCAGRTWQ
jgi:hypothetical protein